MMNNMNEQNAEREVYLSQSRIRLFQERNHYKSLAEQNELELVDARKRFNRVTTGLLILLICVLLGVLFYAINHPVIT
jgi:hypothetical protein